MKKNCIDKAVEDIKEGMSARKAALQWGVPRTTLQNRKKGGFQPVLRRGPPTVLTIEEETLLCDWLIELCHRGIPIQKHFLLDSIQQILTEDNRSNPFVNNRPGKGWFKAFLRRNPNLAERYAEPICRGRAQLTENCIRGWFSDAEEFFTERNCLYVLNDATRQYNGDETGFQLDPRSGRVMAPRNENIYSEAGGTKEQITVLITTRADGEMTPAAIVYPYKRAVPKEIVDKVPEPFVVARSDSGWMTSEIFYEYMANCFIPSLNDLRRKEKNIQISDDLVLDNSDWVIYWIDGYSSHLTLHVSQLCELNYIYLYCFKSHASHICQPNDVGPFKPLKTEWKQAVSEWRKLNPYQIITRQEFAPLLAKTLEKLNKEAIVAGYRATGLCPWNADAVHYNSLTTRHQREKSLPMPMDTEQKPTLTLQPGPLTDGFCYDERNNIVITQILYNFSPQLTHQPDITDVIASVVAAMETPADQTSAVNVTVPAAVSASTGEQIQSDTSDITVSAMETPPDHTYAVNVTVPAPVSASTAEQIQSDTCDVTVSAMETPADHTNAVNVTVPAAVNASTGEHVQSDSSALLVAGATVTDMLLVQPSNLLSESPDVILKHNSDVSASSPCSAKQGHPVWFRGKISPVFASHIFYPSPPKKMKCKKLLPAQLFPACVSTKKWRELHREKKTAKPRTVSKIQVIIYNDFMSLRLFFVGSDCLIYLSKIVNYWLVYAV